MVHSGVAILALALCSQLVLSYANSATSGGDSDAAEGVFQYTIEHSILDPKAAPGSDNYSVRGAVEINYPAFMKERGRLSDLDESASPSTARPASKRGDDGSAGVKFDAFEFDTEQIKAIQRAAASGGYYRVRLVPATKKSGGGGGVGLNAVRRPDAVVASVRACQLLSSNLRELWTFHSDVYGHISAVEYTTPITHCPAAAAPALKSSSIAARGKINFGRTGDRVRAGRAGVALPTGPGAIDPEAAAAAQAAAAAAASANKPEEKSFFAKYWMYIVPFALMMMLNGGQAGAADAAGGGAGGGGGGGGRSR